MNIIPENGRWNEISTLLNYNFEKIEAAILMLKELGISDSRHFNTLEDLEAKFTNPEEGEEALVGTASPYTIYRYVDGAWIDKGTTATMTDYDVAISNLEESVSTLTGTTSRLEGLINGELSDNKAAISVLESSISTLTDTTNQLESSVATLTGSTSGLESSVGTLTETTKTLQESINTLTGTTAQLENAMATKIDGKFIKIKSTNSVVI